MSGTGPRVIDFGVSRAVADEIGLTHPGGQPGTKETKAPEQWDDGPRTTATDVFAWACVVARAGTGRYPFRPVKHAVLNDEPRLDGLDPALRELVEQALRKNPEDRPSADDLLYHLKTAAGPVPQPAPPAAAAAPHPKAPTPRATARSADERPFDDLTTWPAPHPGPQPQPQPRRVPPRRGRRLAAISVAALAAVVAALSAAWLGVVPVPWDEPARTEASSDGPVPGTTGQDSEGPEDLEAAARRMAAEADRVRPKDSALARRLDLAAYRLASSLPETRTGMMLHAFQDGVLAGTVDHTSRVAVNPDASIVAAGAGNDTASIWMRSDPEHPHVVTEPEGGVYSAAFSPDGANLALGGWRVVRLVDPREPGPGRPVLTRGNGEVLGLAFSPDGTRLAVAGWDGNVEVYPGDRPSSPSQPPFTHSTAILSVAFSGDGKTLATGGQDGKIRLWDMADTGSERQPRVLDAGHGPVTGLAFGPDGSGALAAGGGDGTVTVWKDPVGNGPPRVLAARDGEVTSVAFGASVEVVAAGSRNGAVRLWDLTDLDQPVVLRPPGADGSSVAFSGDGKTLAAAVAGVGVQLWNADPEVVADRLCAQGEEVELDEQEWADHVPGLAFRKSCR
jgi:dipeptidyl aminopeptidase/acylaminoacyl peptidase